MVATDASAIQPPIPSRATDPRLIFIRFLKFGCLAWGGPAAQIAMIKRECVDEERLDRRGDLQEAARRLPGPAGPGGARALRLLRPPARRQARRLPRRPRLHAAGLPAHARPLDPLRRGQPRRAPRRPLLRADGGGRRAGRPRPGPAQQNFITDVPLALHRRRRLRPDPLRSASASSSSCSAAASPTSCGRTAGAGRAGRNSFAVAPLGAARRRRRGDHRLADGADLLRGAEGRACSPSAAPTR